MNYIYIYFFFKYLEIPFGNYKYIEEKVSSEYDSGVRIVANNQS